MKIEEQVEKKITEPVEEAGYKIDQISYESGNLTIVIDKNGIIDIDDCVAVTKIVNPILDEADLISESYVLDVCSKEKGSE